MQAFLQVNLLGGFEPFYDDQPVELAHSTRLQTLITFVILHRSAPVVRQRLAYIFWPDTSESQARTNLRNLVHQLRQALPFISTYLTFDNNILDCLSIPLQVIHALGWKIGPTLESYSAATIL